MTKPAHSVDVGDPFLDKQARDEILCRHSLGVIELGSLQDVSGHGRAQGFWASAECIESHMTILMENPLVCSMRGVDPCGFPIAQYRRFSLAQTPC